MTRILITAIAAATLGTAAFASDVATSNDTLMTRSEPATVTLHERDRGISETGFVVGTGGVAVSVDADRYLEPNEQAIASDGEVTAYTFPSNNNVDTVFSPR